MAQVTRLTSHPVGLGSMATQITTLRAAMAAGKDILATDVQALITLYNIWIAHYHSTTDLRGIDTYGNVAVYGGGMYTASTSSSTGLAPGAVPGVTAGGQISAVDINTIRGIINNMRIHHHTITDIVV